MRSNRTPPTLALFAAWAVALAPVPWIGRSLAAFFVLLVAPGFLIDQRLGFGDRVSRAEMPARALTFSVALIGVLAVTCAMLGLSIPVLVVAVAAVSFALVSIPLRAQTSAWDSDGAAPTAVAKETDAGLRPSSAQGFTPAPLTLEARTAAVALALLAIASAVLASLDINLARDRMWYGAYVTHLAHAGAIEWREPMLATGNTAWRFAHNAWIAALAAWSSVGSIGAVPLLERIAPPILVLFLPSSAFALARALVRERGRALVVAACSVVVLLASSYPYFSLERYAFFARIVEDKTAALVLLCPVALSLGIDALASSRPRARELFRFVLALVATALTHAIVFFICALSLAVFAAARLAVRPRTLRAAATVLALCAAVAIAPATLGLRARSTILGVEGPAAEENAIAARTDPVVRAHLRMDRLRDLPAGGPIVEPRLVDEPLLLLALVGLLPAFAARRSRLGGYACATSVVFLALAFLPYLAPLFGRLVVPWMAYRALWGVPFGLLLGALVLGAGDGARRYSATGARALSTVLVLALAAAAAAGLPWSRISSAEDTSKRTAVHADTRALLRAIATLPEHSLIAVAPGLAELVPAYTDRAVLAFSDRGTVAIAGSRELADRRLIANAAILGLNGMNAGMRDALIVRYGVTHVVYEDAPCDLGMTAVYSSGRFVICATPRDVAARMAAAEPERRLRLDAAIDRSMRPTAADAGDLRAPALAASHNGIECEPAPARTKSLLFWQRRDRWSAAFTEVTCRARLSPPQRVRAIRLRAHLPRARETLVFQAEARGPDGPCATRAGTVELAGETSSTIDLRCDDASEVTFRLVPAFLPYLSLRDLELVGAEHGLGTKRRRVSGLSR